MPTDPTPKLEVAAWETRAGRKHTYLSGQLRINEDHAAAFHFDIPSSDGKQERVQCFYIADGHGEIITTNDLHIPAFKSPGQRFVDSLASHLPIITSQLVIQAYNPTNTPPFQVSNELCAALTQLQANVNRVVGSKSPSVCGENGSTLCLAFILKGVLYACSVGDSSMLLVDQRSLKVLPLWKRWNVPEDEMGDICSFEDTLDAFPARMREGQNRKALMKDMRELTGRLKSTREQGETVHLVVSNRSAYALRMTNTVGNLNHAGWTLSRTNVYAIPLTQIPKETCLMMVTDGVKDVLNASELTQLLGPLVPAFTGESQTSKRDKLSNISKQEEEDRKPQKQRSASLSFPWKWFSGSNGNKMDLRSTDVGRWRMELDTRWRHTAGGWKRGSGSKNLISPGLPEVIFRECRDGVAELLVEENRLEEQARLKRLTRSRSTASSPAIATLSKNADLILKSTDGKLGLRQLCRAVILRSLMQGSSDDLTCMLVRIPGVKPSIPAYMNNKVKFDMPSASAPALTSPLASASNEAFPQPEEEALSVPHTRKMSGIMERVKHTDKNDEVVLKMVSMGEIMENPQEAKENEPIETQVKSIQFNRRRPNTLILTDEERGKLNIPLSPAKPTIAEVFVDPSPIIQGDAVTQDTESERGAVERDLMVGSLGRNFLKSNKAEPTLSLSNDMETRAHSWNLHSALDNGTKKHTSGLLTRARTLMGWKREHSSVHVPTQQEIEEKRRPSTAS